MIADLPSIEFADTDAGNIEKSIITMYEAIADRTLAEGDPVRLFLQSVAAIIIQQRVLIDYSAKQNLLAYATEEYLEHLGILVGVTRLQATTAKTMLRFTLSVVQPQVITIPAGIRATTSNRIVFQTSSTAEILAGTMYVDVAAECTVIGTIGNGYIADQVNQFIDPIAWVQLVSNITESAGGSDLESDDSLRERIQQAPESFSVAGPDGAYEYWAKTASQQVIDVAVYSPEPGVVEIRPLLTGGEIPGTEILQAITDACNDRSIRPLTDKVVVLAPTITHYEINLTYYINRDNATTSLTIQQEVNQAVSAYMIWQKSKLKRDINPSELIWRVRAAGASRVEVTSPIYLALEKYQVAVAEKVTINFGGLSDGD